MIKTHILKNMIVTEKAVKNAAVHEDNPGGEQVVVFRVDTKASKPEIKKIIESVYDVKVKSVNTLNQLGKVKFFKQRKGYRSDYKKAYVTLQSGYKIAIPMFDEVQAKEAQNA